MSCIPHSPQRRRHDNDNHPDLFSTRTGWFDIMTASKRLLRNVASIATRSCEGSSSLRARSSAAITFSTSFFPSQRLYTRPTAAAIFRRFNSTQTPKPLTDSKPATPEEAAANEARRAEEPSYLITFTCKPCSHRSGHRISKQGYHKGTVLITCPQCRNRHIISDHLNIFMDTKSTLEDILKRKGQGLKKVVLGEGDLELWPQDSTAATPEAATAPESAETSDKK